MFRDAVIKDCKEKMAKAISVLTEHLETLRTGRATASSLDGVKAPVYGQEMPLIQLGNISTPDGHTILIQPWDKSTLEPIEKAIQAANLGFTPNNDGSVIRINVPSLTQETRKDIVKSAHGMAEEGRVAIRNVRRHCNDEIKKAEKAVELSEDESKRLHDDVQKMTDEHIKKIDALVAEKEKEVMKV